MIESFRDKETERIFQRHLSRRLSTGLHQAAWRKLAMLDAAERLEDLMVPPGNHLEKLSGDRKGQYSVGINNQWRVCFRWAKGDASEVEFTDYHLGVGNERKEIPSRSSWRDPKGGIPRRINEIVRGQRSISANTALRLSRYFGLSERFWLNLQARYDLEAEKDRLGMRLEEEVRVLAGGRAR